MTVHGGWCIAMAHGRLFSPFTSLLPMTFLDNKWNCFSFHRFHVKCTTAISQEDEAGWQKSDSRYSTVLVRQCVLMMCVVCVELACVAHFTVHKFQSTYRMSQVNIVTSSSAYITALLYTHFTSMQVFMYQKREEFRHHKLILGPSSTKISWEWLNYSPSL